MHIEKISDHLWVYDEASGEEWAFLPEHEHIVALGVCGNGRFYLRSSDGALDLFDLRRRERIARCPLDPVSSYLDTQILVSRDQARLFVIDSIGHTASVLHVIETASGRLIRSWSDLPANRRLTVERPDGRLLLYGYWSGDEGNGTLALLIDPETGEREEDALLERRKNVEAPFRVWGFQSVSPDGLWALRLDHHKVPTHTPAKPGLLGGFGRKGGERYYGLVVQLWEAFPLRFVRRITVAWRKVEEMPDATYLAVKRDHPDPMSERRAIWDAIAATAAAADPDPLDLPLPRSAYPAPWSADDERWRAIIKNVEKLVDEREFVAAWQEDGAAFWFKTYPYLSCVGVDGSISPRLKLAQAQSGYPANGLRPLPGRRLGLVYPNGEAILDGAPSGSPYDPVLVPPEAAHWVPGENLPQRQRRQEAKENVRKLEESRHRIRIPVAGWSEDAVIDAIERLSLEIAPGIHRRAVDSHLDLAFVVENKTVSDADFFIRIRSDFPGAAPALRRLIDRYASAIERHQFLFSRGEDGAGLFANAVKTLGLLDPSSIPTLKRYGELVDKGHEYFFAGNTVPAMIERHGWTDEMLDFVFWVLILNYYNTLENYQGVWEQWGMRDAAVRRDPEELARHIVARYGDLLGGTYENAFGAGGLKQLARDIPRPWEPWVERFFAEVARLKPDALDDAEAA